MRSSGKILSVKGKLRKLTFGNHGYQVVSMSRPGYPPKLKCVHHLVAEAFIGERPLRHDVCHNDGDKKNNHADNLRYGTRSENIADSIRHGTFVLGSKRKQAKLTSEDVADILKRWNEGETQRTIAERYNVSRPYISDIVNGRRRTNGL